MTHHLVICSASRSNQRQTSFVENNAGSFRKKGKGTSPISYKTRNRSLSICTRFDMVVFLKGFLALSFDFLHFIHLSTFGFSMKTERLIMGKKKVNFTFISASYAVSASRFFSCWKVGKNWKGVMIVVVRSNWQDYTFPKIKSMGGFFNFNSEVKWAFLVKARGAGY